MGPKLLSPTDDLNHVMKYSRLNFIITVAKCTAVIIMFFQYFTTAQGCVRLWYTWKPWKLDVIEMQLKTQNLICCSWWDVDKKAVCGVHQRRLEWSEVMCSKQTDCPEAHGNWFAIEPVLPSLTAWA